MNSIQALNKSFGRNGANLLGYLLLIGYAFLVWYPVFEFEFLRSYEPAWLRTSRNRFNFIDAYRNHAYLYYLNYKLFGWNPRGWYLTGILAHSAGVIAFVVVMKRMISELARDYAPDQFGLVFGLIFIGSFVYMDVVSWGSFNSHYGFLLFLQSLTILGFLEYEKRKRYFFSIGSWCTYLAALLTRETAILAVVLITVFTILRARERGGVDSGLFFRDLTKKLTPYFWVTILFLIFRKIVGGVSGDMADETVQNRLTLLANREYFELLWRIGLTFFKNFSTLFIPFPWLNEFQIFLSEKFGRTAFFTHYLFSTIGLVTYVTITAICVKKFLKNDGTGRLLALSYVLMVFPLLFVAIAMPSTDAVIAMPFGLFTRRYNYFAFLGAAIFGIVFLFKFSSLWKKSNKFLCPKNILISATGILLSLNFIILRPILKSIYETEHAAYKKFILDFKKISKNFSEDTVIYYHPCSPDINDYLFALSLTASYVYKNVSAKDVKEENIWKELNGAFRKIKEKSVSDKDMLFLSYSRETGLVNHTDAILDIRRSGIEIPLTLNAVTEFEEKKPERLVSEIPYAIEFEFEFDKIESDEPSTGPYSDFMEWYKTLFVETGPTLGPKNAAYLYTDSKNMIDLNIDNGFDWSSDGFKNYVKLSSDIDAEMYGLWIIAPSKDYCPSFLEVVYSDGKGARKKVKSETILKPWGMLVLFEKKIRSNNLTLIINHTYKNTPVISEMNIITKSILLTLNQGFDMSKIIDRIIKPENTSHGFWVFVEWVLSDGERQTKKSLRQFVDAGRRKRCLIPFLESEMVSAGSINSFMKSRYKSVKVVVSPKVLDNIRVKKLNFVKRY